MTTALFMLRCSQLGLRFQELKMMTIGMVIDMLIEQANDHCDYDVLATQADFDAF